MLLVRSLAATFFGGYRIEPHAHQWGQLIYAVSGLMRVRSERTLWIVPPARAIWAPAGVVHEIRARGDFAMRTLYLHASLAERLPPACVALEVSPLLRELILHAVGIGILSAEDDAQARLAGVIGDRLAAATVLPFDLPLPADPRALRLAETLRDDPSSRAALTELAGGAGASTRTIQRLFLAETGLPFAQWRQRLRLLHGAALLSGGMSVTDAGLDAGYSGTSAFIAAFRKHFGFTPSRLGERTSCQRTGPHQARTGTALPVAAGHSAATLGALQAGE